MLLQCRPFTCSSRHPWTSYSVWTSSVKRAELSKWRARASRWLVPCRLTSPMACSQVAHGNDGLPISTSSVTLLCHCSLQCTIHWRHVIINLQPIITETNVLSGWGEKQGLSHSSKSISLLGLLRQGTGSHWRWGGQWHCQPTHPATACCPPRPQKGIPAWGLQGLPAPPLHDLAVASHTASYPSHLGYGDAWSNWAEMGRQVQKLYSGGL